MSNPPSPMASTYAKASADKSDGQGPPSPMASTYAKASADKSEGQGSPSPWPGGVGVSPSQGGPVLTQTDDGQPVVPTLQQPGNQPFDQPQTVAQPLGQKEQEPVTQAEPLTSTEEIEIQEVQEQEQVPEEVQGWVERVERGEDIHLARPVVHQGETLVAAVGPQSTKVVLPLTEEATKLALHRKVVESIRWLAVWCWRLVRKLPERVMYEEPKGMT